MGTFWQDMRYGVRTLAKSPGFTLVAVLTMALGIGANTAIFTVVNAVLLRPLAFRDPGRVVLVREKSPYPTFSTSYENYKDWRDQSRSFESMQASCLTAMTLTGMGEPELIQTRYTTAGFFPLLGVTPVAGRNFLPDEDRAESAPVAMISYGLWQRRFGGTRESIGKTIELGSKAYTLIGVVPASFQFLQPADAYVAFEPWAKTLPDDRNWHPGIFAVARLKPGMRIEQADAEMKGITARLEKQYPDYNTGISADVVKLQDQVVQNVRPALIVLLCAVGFILLIACANVANLLLARAASRAREFAIRTALGAGQMRLIRQLLTESFVIAILGGALGLWLASVSLNPLLRLAAGAVPDVSGIEIDRWVLAFTLAAALVTGIVFGLIPAWRAAKLDLREALNEGGRGGTGGAANHRLLSAFVISEFAIAMLLLVGAGLLLRSFDRMQAAAAGFATDHLLVADVPLSQNAYPKPAQRFEFFDRVVDGARALPGVRSAGAASYLPMSGTGGMLHFNIYGRPPKSPHEYIAAGYRTISEGYLETLGVPLMAGRTIRRSDDEKAPGVVVVNTSFAKEHFGGESPLGKRMQLGAIPDETVPWMEIVGVVGDVRRGLGTEPQAEMYLPFKQADALLPVLSLSIVLRTGVEPATEASALRGVLAGIDKNQPLVKVRTMEDNMKASAVQPRFRTWLLGLFALLALLLSTIGIYGVMSYSVTQRVQEIGIRMALGAQPVQVFQRVTGEGLRLALIGVGVGFVGSLALTRVLRSFLYEVSAIDPITYGVVAGILIAVGLLASYLPARRATRVDPLVALRHE
jgi:putative ABC transport system permease protein